MVLFTLHTSLSFGMYLLSLLHILLGMIKRDIFFLKGIFKVNFIMGKRSSTHCEGRWVNAWFKVPEGDRLLNERFQFVLSSTG